jgi:hypothetical protein
MYEQIQEQLSNSRNRFSGCHSDSSEPLCLIGGCPVQLQALAVRGGLSGIAPSNIGVVAINICRYIYVVV